MNIDSIQNGIVIDHITAGKGMTIYRLLELDRLECMVALIKNANSDKMGRKDIIKIDSDVEIDTDVLGYVDPDITVNIIRDSKLVQKKKISLPEELHGVLKCRNPRCISSVEQELPMVFRLTNRTKREYRCIYCETKA